LPDDALRGTHAFGIRCGLGMVKINLPCAVGRRCVICPLAYGAGVCSVRE
jgi:hypothetical protein